MALLVHVQEKKLKSQSRSLQTDTFLMITNSLLTAFKWGSLVTTLSSGRLSMSLQIIFFFLQMQNAYMSLRSFQG